MSANLSQKRISTGPLLHERGMAPVREKTEFRSRMPSNLLRIAGWISYTGVPLIAEAFNPHNQQQIHHTFSYDKHKRVLTIETKEPEKSSRIQKWHLSGREFQRQSDSNGNGLAQRIDDCFPEQLQNVLGLLNQRESLLSSVTIKLKKESLTPIAMPSHRGLSFYLRPLVDDDTFLPFSISLHRLIKQKDAVEKAILKENSPEELQLQDAISREKPFEESFIPAFFKRISREFQKDQTIPGGLILLKRFLVFQSQHVNKLPTSLDINDVNIYRLSPSESKGQISANSYTDGKKFGVVDLFNISITTGTDTVHYHVYSDRNFSDPCGGISVKRIIDNGKEYITYANQKGTTGTLRDPSIAVDSPEVDVDEKEMNKLAYAVFLTNVQQKSVIAYNNVFLSIMTQMLQEYFVKK